MMSNVMRTVVWKCLFEPGLEFFALRETADGWQLAGTVVAVRDEQPLRVDYRVDCSADWRTRRVELTMSSGADGRELALRVDDAGAWCSGDDRLGELSGFVDVDLGITPATNTLPIRRLSLAIGASAAVSATWIQFPSLVIGPLSQHYTRLAERRYRYESDTGFECVLDVDQHGLVTHYPDGWEMIAGS
ncbi:MAG: putative glycolipid-binding domain-containing protein, partial [Vicinamibacterales bacterium]